MRMVRAWSAMARVMAWRFLDKVEEQHAAAHVPLGDGHHQAQVGFGQLFLGFLVALLHALGDFDFFLGGQKRYPADFF